MKSLVLLASVSFSYTNFSGKPIEGSGRVKEELRRTSAFHGLSLSHSIDAQVSPGPFQVKVSGDDNIVPYIVTDVAQGILTIKLKSGPGFQTQTPVKVFIQVPRLDSIHLSGASRLAGRIESPDRLVIETSGGSQLKLDSLRVKTLHANTSGASLVNLARWEGEALALKTSGGSSFEADSIQATKLDIQAHGASQIDLEGRLNSADIRTSGGAHLELNHLTLETVSLEASGASDLQLKGARTVSGEQTGGSTVHVDRAARVAIDRTNAARLIQN